MSDDEDTMVAQLVGMQKQIVAELTAMRNEQNEQAKVLAHNVQGVRDVVEGGTHGSTPRTSQRKRNNKQVRSKKYAIPFGEKAEEHVSFEPNWLAFLCADKHSKKAKSFLMQALIRTLNEDGESLDTSNLGVAYAVIDAAMVDGKRASAAARASHRAPSRAVASGPLH